MIPQPETGRIICECCGEPARCFVRGRWGRCALHEERNPCAIGGCTRTTSAKGDTLRSDLWICGTHWRRWCPPRGRLRRAYNAFFRHAKRHGWTDESTARYWRFWFRLVRRARKLDAAGAFDVAAINRLFGWDKIDG